MVGRGLGGDGQALGPGRPHHLDAAPGGQVLEVHPGAGEAGQGDVAQHHQLLGLGGLAGDAEAARPRPFVHVPARGERVVLAVLGQGDAEAGGVLERPAHQAGVLHAVAVVGEEAHAEGGHLGHRRQRSPARPTVMAPATSTSHSAASRPSSWTSRTTPALSMAGSVLGIATTAVKPPSAAARAPVSTVSASSRPGWRRWVWRSTRPGATTQPPASSTVAAVEVRADGHDRGRPDRPRRPAARPGGVHHGAAPEDERQPFGSSLRSAVGTAELHARAQQPVQDGHPHGHAVGDLGGDDRVGQVGDLGGDLDAAVHRTGVHDQRVAGQPPGPLGREPEAGGVLPQARHQRLLLALELHPQQVGHVELRHHVVEVVASPRRPSPPALGGSSVRRRHQRDLRAEGGEGRTLERATRLCLTSPMMPTWRPSSSTLATAAAEVLGASCSSRAGPGWGARATVAGVDDAGRRVHRLICHGTPADPWRTTTASMPMARCVSTVSRRLSPFFTLDEPTLKVIVSAESRLAAVSNQSRVRVESS